MAASLHDVAGIAGVSISTASRALNHPEMVATSTRERVHLAANALGYIPQGAGRALVSRCTFSIGAVIPRIGISAFGQTVEALRRGLGNANYTLLLAQPSADEQTDPRPLRTLIERGVDGVVLLGNDHPPSWPELIHRNGIPLVTIWTDSSHSVQGAIGFDNYAAGKLAAAHLLALGHRHFAFISGRLAVNLRARMRYQGLLETIAASGGHLPRESVLETDYGFAHGYEAASELLKRDRLFSALVCGNDYLAVGAMARLEQDGLTTPGDVSVIGFNNSEFAKFLKPPLTTIHFPSAEIGTRAAQALVDVLLGQNEMPPAQILPTPLIERNSTGRAYLTQPSNRN